MNAQKFFLRLSAYLGVTTPVAEQIEYRARLDAAINERAKILLELDGGGGKTLAYLVSILFEATKTGKPAIIATSTISNRNQVIGEFDKIQRFAATIDHPIATIPLVNYRSVHDYCSTRRIENLLVRLRALSAPNSIISELDEVLQKAQQHLDRGEAPLVDEVLPVPIMRVSVADGHEVAQTYITRDDIAVWLSESHAAEIDADRCKQRIGGQWIMGATRLKDFAGQPCVIVVTQAMLAKHRTLREWIKTDDVAAVVIDECDRMLGLDFLSNIDVSLADLDSIITTLRDDLDVRQAEQAVRGLRSAIDDIRSHFKSDKPVMLRQEIMPDVMCKAVIAAVKTAVDEIAKLVDYETPDMKAGDLNAEHRDRIFATQLDEVIGGMNLFHEQFQASPSSEMFRLQDDADVRLFLKWDGDDPSLHIVTISPGRTMKWLTASSVPVVLTTAFVGVEHERFAREIGLFKVHPSSAELRMPLGTYGRMRFTYFTGMPNPIDYDAVNRRYGVNPAYLLAVAQEIRASYRAGSRMLVLCPAYYDIAELAKHLEGLPVLAQQRGVGISKLRTDLIEKPGILLTVLWEGYNLVSEQTTTNGRRGVLDTIVITRLPFPQPNEMLKVGLSSIYGKKAEWWLWDRQLFEVIRTVYQGICRGVRGPNDQCEVFIMDPRMPPPVSLRRQNPLIQIKPGHKDLVRAIPTRFASSPRNFTWKNVGTVAD